MRGWNRGILLLLGATYVDAWQFLKRLKDMVLMRCALHFSLFENAKVLFRKEVKLL